MAASSLKSIRTPELASHSPAPGATSQRSNPTILLPETARRYSSQSAWEKESPPGTGVPVPGQYSGDSPSMSKLMYTFCGNASIIRSQSSFQVLPL